MATPRTPGWSARPPFSTLDLCIAHVRKAHPQKLIPAPAKEIESGRPIEATMPSCLYRGEVGWFDECLSRAERVRRGHFVGVTTQELDPIGQDLDSQLQARLGVGPMLSAGLMQHYGYPTELMDATASLDTAAFFSRLDAGETSVGALAVFDMQVLTRNGIVIDLTSHPSAVRPRRQSAYGVFHRRYRDLKRQEAVEEMGITWYTFLGDPVETARVSAGAGLLSVANDETAGILRLWLDGSIAEHHKVSHLVADYLANRIAHCPLVSTVKSWYSPGQPKEIVLVAPAVAGLEINEAAEIRASTELWSRNHPQVVKR